MRIEFKSAATALVLCLVFQVQADTLLGKVINVADGDTITVLDDTNTQHKIRLTGIKSSQKVSVALAVKQLGLFMVSALTEQASERG